MIRIIAILVAVAIVAILGLAATKPDTVHVRRSTSVKAPPERIFGYISDFHRWSEWSPWDKLDPTMRRAHSGAAMGRGAVYEWDGNRKVGKGRMEITDATPPARVAIALDFLKPFAAHNTTEFTIAPRGDATNVTWEMRGPNPYMMKVMGIFVNMDRMIGKDFETGLANLKAAAER